NPDDAIKAKLSESLTFVKTQVQTPPASNQYGPLGTEVQNTHDVAVQANELGVPNVDAETKTLYLDPALQPIRAAAWQTGLQTQSQDHYLPLISAFGALDAWQQDAQYVATSIQVTTKDANGAVLGQITLGKGANAGQQLTHAVLPAAKDGSVEISGAVATLHCPSAAVEHLAVNFEAITIDDLQSSGDILFSGSTVAHSSASLLSAAGITPQNAAQQQMVIRRLGSSCTPRFAIVDDTLASVTLDFTAPQTAATSMTWKGSAPLTSTWLYIVAAIGGGNYGSFYAQGVSPPVVTLHLVDPQMADQQFMATIDPGTHVSYPGFDGAVGYEAFLGSECTLSGTLSGAGTIQCDVPPTSANPAQYAFTASWTADGKMSASIVEPSIDCSVHINEGCAGSWVSVALGILSRQ
ncbi:MAG TPA: hypothetical protein VET48_01610, partial [Steroidobacteraceae bacterium]|nr:hypothetical protein [Steroidobacteraceae bacterium]